jgi:hypothetical protein
MKDCVKIYMRSKNTMRTKFLMIGQRICLTTDMWTSIQNMNYLCVTEHFIDRSWIYQKRILAFCQVSDHKRQTIARELEQCLVELWIVEMLTILVDNATANDTAVE